MAVPAAAVAGAIPLSLYVHIPWCVRKCPYCDFNSHVPRSTPDQAAYVDALLLDLDHEIRLQAPTTLASVFIGGGTPSLFGGRQIGRLLDGIAGRVGLAADAEITLEANPGTAEAQRFADYRAAGVNRLSIGVQSLDDRKLRALGRIHSAAEAVAAVRMARAAGFDNVNLDLMYGLPEQSPAEAMDDLARAIALQPEHLSWYQLTLEPNTPFFQAPPALPDDDLLVDIMDAGRQSLADAGYARYEISAYARAGRRCRHNLNYWEFGDYLGIGAGAHGKRTRPDGRVVRRSKRRGPEHYLREVHAGAVSTEQLVAAADLPVEFMLNALRLTEGVPEASFAARTGLAPGCIEGAVDEARRLGLLEPSCGLLRPTPHGLRFLNELLVLFEPG